MRKRVTLTAAVAILFVGSLAWSAEAATAQGAAKISTSAASMSLVRDAACRGWGPWCRPGFTRVCGRWGRCWCRPCW